MTKEQAIDAMLNGAKVTHPFFLKNEYIYMESGKIFDENDYELFTFWEHRMKSNWQDNWSIYRGETGTEFYEGSNEIR